MIKRYLFLVLFLLSLYLSYAADNARIDSLLSVLSQKQPRYCAREPGAG